jgi:hypothetical protein
MAIMESKGLETMRKVRNWEKIRRDRYETMGKESTWDHGEGKDMDTM